MNDALSSPTLPIPILKRRSVDPSIEKQALALGLSAVAARVIGARKPCGASLERWLSPTLSELDSAHALADIDFAAQRLAGAILSHEVIGIASDYDMDGLGAHAAFRIALIQMWGHPAAHVRSYIGHRLTEGYGLTAQLSARIFADTPRVSVLVTADCGSSDEPRIARLKAAGIDVLVTDHHEVPGGRAPPSSYACVNPQRLDCGYADKAIAGGMVLWLLLRVVHEVLCEAGHVRSDAVRLEELLDFVACSTVADCVSLSSRNNRAVVRAGVALMNGAHRPCWKAFAQLNETAVFTSQTIAYGIAPRINARTRLSDPFAALHFLLAEDEVSARRALQMLDAENRARRAIEKTMVEDALHRAARLVEAGAQSIVLALPEGHPGVQGICSSRLVESFGRPVFLFSPHTAQRDVLTGSARTVEGVHVQQILVEIDRRAPGLIASFGGHKAAAGAQIRARDFQGFQTLFETVTRESVGATPLAPARWSDGPLHAESLKLALVHELAALEPTGRGCEPATFDGTFDIENVRSMGDGTHLRLILRSAGARFAAVWFRARSNAGMPLPVRPRDRAHFLYSLTENLFGGVRRMQLRIEALISAPQRAASTSSVRFQSRPTCPAPFRPRAARTSRRIG